MADISLIRAASITASDNLTQLFTELSAENGEPDIDRINALIESGSLALYLAISDGKPVGMVSIIPCRTASHDKLWIEDVCTLSECRGQGIGRKLLSYAMEDALEFFGPASFWLTSRPSRVAARAMYASMGFKEVETGVLRKIL